MGKHINKTYNNIIKEVLKNGFFYENKRRKTERMQIPSYTFRHEMKDGFPLISNRDVHFNSIVGELIWFLRGDTHTKYLYDNRIKIWEKDNKNWYNKVNNTNLTTKEFVKKVGSYETGLSYPHQWRNFAGQFDQIADIITKMQTDIMGSRIKLSAWNSAEQNKTGLPPCHTGFINLGIPLSEGNYGFELHWEQRSCDLYLGIPFNIASYALLGLYLEAVTGHKFLALQGDLKNVHLYDNSIVQSLKLLKRTYSKEHAEVELDLSKMSDPLDFNNLNISDFELLNYDNNERLDVKMLEPVEI